MPATVTITLPVFNALPYLRDAVQSVLGQSYRDFRFLIIDDGSHDGSTEYLRSLRDPRVRVVCRENRGLGATLNELFDRSETEYVVRMDADDLSAPIRLERLMRFLKANPEVVMAGSDQAFLSGTHTLKAAPRPVEHEVIRHQLLNRRFGVLHPTIVVRRDAWKRVGGYRVSGTGEDLDFCLRLCDAGKVANVPEVLYYYRLHNSSISNLRAREIHLGYDYGIACARARQWGKPEPGFEEFSRQWASRPIYAKLSGSLGDFSQSLYRAGLAHQLHGRPLVSAGYYACAAALRPGVAAQRLWGALGNALRLPAAPQA